MKTTIRALIMLTFLLALSANVWATSVTFTPDISTSSVIVTDNAKFGDMKGTLVLTSTPFTLADNATQELDFFTLTARGLAWNKDYTVEALLAFSTPFIEGEGTGGGHFSTLFGVLSGGNLTWDSNTIPDYFTLADGNKIKIDFESGSAFGFGSTAMVHAYVTNMGGGVPESVPEPVTLLLLGAGLVGLAGAGRKFKK